MNSKKIRRCEMKSDSTNLAKNTIVVGIVMAMVMTVFVGIASATHEVWSDDIRITTDPEASTNPVIVIDSNNNSHISWQANRDGSSEIYYAKLNYSANIQINEKRLTNDSERSSDPVIALDSDSNVHIAWIDTKGGGFLGYKIYYTKLDNNGDTLVDDKQLTHHLEGALAPTIAVDANNTVHITWSDYRGGNPEIYYTKLDNNGDPLIDDKKLTYAPDRSYKPAIAVDLDNNVHISWYDGTVAIYKGIYMMGIYEIYYTKLDNNGSTLVDIRRVTPYDLVRSCRPTIATDSNNNVHIAWDDERDGNWEIYYTKLADNGNTLIDDMRITNFSGDSKLPKIAIDTDNNVHIIWEDNRDGNTEIYYTKLDKNGDTLINVTGLTVDHVTSDDPAIAIDSNNNVHITWVDNRDGNREIYYKHTISNMQK